jgi:Raf kinase inhibitor-like YbhB/YbcL family protein
MTLTLGSPAFDDAQPIPRRHTCEGENVSPALAWSGVPDQAQTLALLVEDPDAPDPLAPTRIFAHWLVYNIPPDATGLVEDADTQGLPRGARAGKNDFGQPRWGGPCPPIGRHRYYFKLYALDSPLPTSKPLSRTALLDAIDGHVLAYAELMGTYQKERGASST